MSIHAAIRRSTSQRALLLRDAAKARKERRGAARALARHHGRDLVAIIGRGGCAEAVAMAEGFVDACAKGEPCGSLLGAVLSGLARVLRQSRATAPHHVRAERHRARLVALHAITVRLEALEAALDVAEPAGIATPEPTDPARDGFATA